MVKFLSPRFIRSLERSIEKGGASRDAAAKTLGRGRVGKQLIRMQDQERLSAKLSQNLGRNSLARGRPAFADELLSNRPTLKPIPRSVTFRSSLRTARSRAENYARYMRDNPPVSTASPFDTQVRGALNAARARGANRYANQATRTVSTGHRRGFVRRLIPNEISTPNQFRNLMANPTFRTVLLTGGAVSIPYGFATAFDEGVDE